MSCCSLLHSNHRPFLLGLLLLLVPTALLQAQRSAQWQRSVLPETLQRGERRIVPSVYSTIGLDIDSLRNFLNGVEEVDVRTSDWIIALPLPEGGEEQFRCAYAPIMAPELAARYPEIRTFVGESVVRAGVTVRFDITIHGFHAMVFDMQDGDWFIDPYAFGVDDVYISYRRRHFSKPMPEGFRYCSYDEVNDLEEHARRMKQWEQEHGGERAGDCQKRTYRLALACTGEYANYHGSNTTNNNKSFALSAMVTSMNRVNAMFIRDVAVQMNIIANNDLVIYLNPATDPYTNNSGSTMLNQNQTTCDNVIGFANYDIGHVFSTGGGGVAQLNAPCGTGKARGVTGSGAPVGDPFDIDYVAHEIGHQYGANHTQYNGCNRSNNSAFEPGSASTIMGYAGICSPNVQSNSDALFHGRSIQEMTTFLLSASASCDQVIASGNQQPSLTAPAVNFSFTIPRSTPFVLTASGSDPDPGTALTYSWEQMNNAGTHPQPPVATNPDGPNFRTNLPATSPARYFPNLNAVVANTTPTWEVLSSVARTMNFRVNLRDNFATAGCTAERNGTVTVNGTAGPFLVTQPNTNVSWAASSPQTVTWDVAGTTATPVSCANVDILLSVDGGFTYPYTLLTSTPNDGTQSVTLTGVPSTTSARIMVRANGNIFYDISNTNFTITATQAPDYTLAATPASVAICQPSNAVYTVTTTSLASYNSPVTLSATGLPVGLTINFSTNPVIPGGSSTLTLSNTQNVAVGTYAFNVNSTSASGNKTVPLQVVVSATPGAVSYLTPANGATGVNPGSALTWSAVTGAASYTVRIATDAAMSNVVETAAGVTVLSFPPAQAINQLTTYHWTVQAVNSCSNGAVTPSRSFTTTSCVPVTVEITQDRYGNETTWQVVQGATVFASGGPYTNLGTNGIVALPSVPLCLAPGCYELKVFDSWGDGNCCAYGVGFIRVRQNSDNVVLANVSATAFFTSTAPFCITAPQVQLTAGVWLEGPYSPVSGLMRDDLRAGGLLPLTEPYTALGHVQVAGGGGESTSPSVLSVTGVNAIADWVRLELRSASTPSQVIATRQALLQRDGDIVATDGISPVVFNVPAGNYHVVVGHRNHLGVMTASPVALSNTALSLDMRLAGTPTNGTQARKSVTGENPVLALWAGDATGNGVVLYTGSVNDRDAVLTRIGGLIPTNAVTGYFTEDSNLDGLVKYLGSANDRDIILLNVPGPGITLGRSEQVP